MLLTPCSFVVVAALSQLSDLQNHLASANLVGAWRVIGTESPDGTFQKANADQRGYRFLITHTTITMYYHRDIVWAATYRLDPSRIPTAMYQSVTRAPCLCGASRDFQTPYALNGNRLKLDGMILQKKKL